jgi:FkbM family methyltransferase
VTWFASAARRLKFATRVWLTRFGLHCHIERWRLHRLIRAGRPHEDDFAFCRHFTDSDGLFLDIGANIGQSALSFHLFNRTIPILSFEPNPDMDWHLSRIKAHLGPGFDYQLVGVGGANEERRYYVPVVCGVPLTQEATFHPEQIRAEWYRERIHSLTGHRRFDVAERVLRVVRLDDLDLRPAVVKIDVQGGEEQALRGMARTIDRHRPLFLFESNLEANHFLALRDYIPMAYRPDLDTLVPWNDQMCILNIFGVPRERLAGWHARGIARRAA